MGTRKKIHEAIIQGVLEGLRNDHLYAFVKEHAPKASDRKIARVGLDALSDPELTDRNVLNVIYAMAIKRRLIAERPSPSDDGKDG